MISFYTEAVLMCTFRIKIDTQFSQALSAGWERLGVDISITLEIFYFYNVLYEPVCEKINNFGFRPGPTQTRLYSLRVKPEA